MATGTRTHKCAEDGCHAEGCPRDDEACELADVAWCVRRCNPEQVTVQLRPAAGQPSELVPAVREALNACEFGGDLPGDDAWDLLLELKQRGFCIVPWPTWPDGTSVEFEWEVHV